MSAEINGSLVNLNGIISQGENIGDNGGFKQSYRCALSGAGHVPIIFRAVSIMASYNR